MNELLTMFGSLQMELEAHRPRPDRGPTDAVTGGTPVTVLTGFLGAGKSTLLAALLAAPSDLSVRAVVNDIGSLPFDPSLEAVEGRLEIEFSNGCGCCEATSDLSATLDRLALTGPDVVVLEASGAADPFAVAQVIEASARLRLDRIVTVVDAVTFQHRFRDPRTAPVVLRQLDAAQSVVISRADLITGDERAALIDELTGLAPGRTIESSTLADPALNVLLPGSLRGVALPTDTAAPEHDLIAWTVDQTGVLLLRDLERALEGMSPEIVRCKGRLSTDEGSFLVQATSAGWETAAGPRRATGQSRVTIVGTGESAVAALAAALGCT